MLVARDFATLRIIAVDAGAVRADPDDPLGILGQIGDEVAAQAVGILRFMADRGEFVAVEAVKAVLGAEPQEPLSVLQDSGDDALR